MSHARQGRTPADQGSYTELAPEWAETSWFRFPRDFIRDERLSWESRAVAAWMASHDPSFRFDVAYIVKAGPAGRDKVRRIMSELETAGYLVRTRTRNRDGSFGPIIYRLHPEPQSTIRRSEPATGNPAVDSAGVTRISRSSPAPENPATADPATASQEGHKKTDLQEKRTPPPRENSLEALAVEVDASEEEMGLLVEKVRRDHPHVKVPLAWLRTCHANGDLAAMLADVRATASATVRLPEWCGECDSRTRQVELDDGRPARCPRCHPLRKAAS